MSNGIIRPLLAATVKDVTKLRFPLLASPKLDGIRCILTAEGAYSRSGKLLPNDGLQRWARSLKLMKILDGELIVGNPTSKTCFQDTQSEIMSDLAKFTASYYCFDVIESDYKFETRLECIKNSTVNIGEGRIYVVGQTEIANVEQLQATESRLLEVGYEGVMLRDPEGLYKHGRSTLKEQTLLKLKRFEDSEAKVIGWEPLQINTNEAKLDELGHTKRSSAQAGKVASTSELGMLRCVTADGVEFGLGSGFTSEQRQQFFALGDALIGKFVKYKHFTIGAKIAPRFPVFLGFRDPIDF